MLDTYFMHCGLTAASNPHSVVIDYWLLLLLQLPGAACMDPDTVTNCSTVPLLHAAPLSSQHTCVWSVEAHSHEWFDVRHVRQHDLQVVVLWRHQRLVS
jgi:hypothetical protein